MVLWEITLFTAYWLGLRKTYRLALKLQRRAIGPRFPRLRDFLHRRTRNVFDVALTVQKGIQNRDLAGRKGVGNFILRFLDRMRPSAEVLRPPPQNHGSVQKGSSMTQTPHKSTNVRKQADSSLGSLHNKMSFSHPLYQTQIGKAIRNRITSGIGSIKSGIGKPKTGPGVRTMASGMYHNSSLPSFPSLNPITTALPAWTQVSSSFPLRNGVFREDIAWMMLKRPKRMVLS